MHTTEEWMVRGLCRDYPVSFFFPNDANGATAAQAVCARCPVKRLCAEYAITECIDYGTFGGLSERERARIRKRRGLPAGRCGS